MSLAGQCLAPKYQMEESRYRLPAVPAPKTRMAIVAVPETALISNRDRENIFQFRLYYLTRLVSLEIFITRFDLAAQPNITFKIRPSS
jgi:hypothetical protein